MTVILILIFILVIYLVTLKQKPSKVKINFIIFKLDVDFITNKSV